MAQPSRFSRVALPLFSRPATLPATSLQCRYSSDSKSVDWAEGLSHARNPRWQSELQGRLKKLKGMDLSPEIAEKSKNLATRLTRNWVSLFAGREGFVAGLEWRGLNRHEVAWGDMDSMGHVNNVKYNRWAESARVNWFRNFTNLASPEHKREWAELMSPRNVGLILRSIKTDYKFPMKYPDRTTVLHKLIRSPDYDSDHVLLEAVILSERYRRPAARCFEDIVVYDYRAAKKTPLKPFMVDELQKMFKRQQESKELAEKEIEEFFVEVAEIEGLAGVDQAREAS